jgi:hypothetical protein
MDLREIRKEVHSLPNVQKELKNFKNSWVKPFRKNNNLHLPFLKHLDKSTKKELNQKLLQLQSTFKEIDESQVINDKLQHYSRYLIEMKLSTFNGDEMKSEVLSNQMLNDDFMSIKSTINEVKSFSEKVNDLQQQYEEVSELLHQNLSLDQIIFFMDLPHKKYLKSLLKTSDKQQKIVRHIGRHFVALTKQTQLKKMPSKY